MTPLEIVEISIATWLQLSGFNWLFQGKTPSPSWTPSIDWMFVSTKIPMSNLIFNMVVFGGESFGRWLSTKGETLINWITALKKGDPRMLPYPVHHVRTERRCLSNTVGIGLSLDSESTSALIFDFPACRTMRNKCYLNQTVYAIFVTATWMD